MVEMINNDNLQKNSIFRVGEIYSVDGRTVCVKVDKDKNLSHILYQGDLVKNVSVGSYLKILKGFTQIVAKVESEYIKENKNFDILYHQKSEEIVRVLVVKLIGYIEMGNYYKGVKELPLIGNVCLLMDNSEFSLIHRFAKTNEPTIKIGSLLNDENVPIEIGINNLFTSHIGIFGNTGSGKSCTLANLYKNLFNRVDCNKRFRTNARFALYDFNGEYSASKVITSHKKVYNLSTQDNRGENIPLLRQDLLNPELVFILSNATEKTQQPFIRRTLNLYGKIFKAENKEDALNHFKNLLVLQLKHTLLLKDAQKSRLIFDYASQILPAVIDVNTKLEVSLTSDLELYSNGNFCKYSDKIWIDTQNIDTAFETLRMKQAVVEFEFPTDFLSVLICFLYLRLMMDVLDNHVNNEHIAPAINKLKSFRKDFDKVFEINDEKDFWDKNYFVVINLNHVNLNIKKLLPLLISYKLYTEHKRQKEKDKSLNIIIDEAHNILSYESMRESEMWKDFRLETFEEIIKEGRKFGVFLTIASQRPSDISATIISQLHNFFIHRLVNNKDLEMIEKAVSYLDKLSIETLPILPVGACVLSGIIADLPILIQMDKMEEEFKPESSNISLLDSWLDNRI